MVTQSLQKNGYDFLRGILSFEQCQEWVQLLESRFQHSDNGPLRSARTPSGSALTYGSRNVLSLVPEVTELVHMGPVYEACVKTLGKNFGIVRGLFFDKPPGASWSLAWHQDLTIAVKDHTPLKSTELTEESPNHQESFQKPTVKAGICHVEAPCRVLEKMLTLRFHLDPMTEKNGALYVRPGSHLHGKLLHADVVEHDAKGSPIYCEAGDVMIMRPLLSHASIGCDPSNKLHRRIIHLELAASQFLAKPFEWQVFLPIHSIR